MSREPNTTMHEVARILVGSLLTVNCQIARGHRALTRHPLLATFGGRCSSSIHSPGCAYRPIVNTEIGHRERQDRDGEHVDR